ncbi:MAG: hypothetical protein R2761_06645 [Acidimicrobiales bacterium]
MPNWPELGDTVKGFRPGEACDIAASWFDRLTVVDEISRPIITPAMRLLNDGSGRMVDTETGELITLQPDQELRTGKAVVLRRLVISGGKVAIECGRISHPDMTNVEAAMLLGSLLDEAAAATDDQWDDLDDGEDGPWNVVTVFTRKSRQRLRQKVAEADWWTPLQRDDSRVGMLTLTYPGEWEPWAPNPNAITKHRNALEKRMARALGYGPAFFWVREWQARWAPHFHWAGVFPVRISGRRLEEWLSLNWWQVVGSNDPDHLKAGTRVDWERGLAASDPNRLAAYFSSYSAKDGDKEYQHQPPPGWANDNGSVGRHWGYRNVEFVRSEVRLSYGQHVEVMRFLRAYLRSQKRTERTRMARISLGGRRKRSVNRRYQLRSLTGPDTGLTFLTNDGPALAIAIARALTPQEQPWRPGERRALP